MNNLSSNIFSAGVRRVVVGQGEAGLSCVLSDSMVKVDKGSADYLQFAELWQTQAHKGEIPITSGSQRNLSNGILPTAGGTRLVIELVHPDGEGHDEDAIRRMFSSIGAGHTRIAGADSVHPGMHKTDTVDYIYIIAGEIVLILESGEVTVRAGDIIIDGGAVHSWANRSNKTCVMLASVIAADPAPVMVADNASVSAG